MARCMLTSRLGAAWFVPSRIAAIGRGVARFTVLVVQRLSTLVAVGRASALAA